MFTGDIGFDRYMSGKWTDEGLAEQCILDFLHSGRHVVANVEGALMRADGAAGVKSVYFHAMDPDAVRFLKKIRADIWTLANNHIMDAGTEGLKNTIKIAGETGCRTMGAGTSIEQAAKPVYLDEAGGIGLFATAYQPDCPAAGKDKAGSLSWNDLGTIRQTAADIKRKCRWCIMVCHGGEEFAGTPMPTIRDRYLGYLDMGVDFIVAHHPHVPQHYEILDNGKAIFYSLGNFIFDTDYQRAQYHTDTGVLLKLILNENTWRLEALGMRLDREKGKLSAAELPDIFTDIGAEDYRLLTPLSAKATVAAEKRRMIFLDPDKYKAADEKIWNAYFDGSGIEGYIKGEYMDFKLIRSYIDSKPAGKPRPELEKVIEYLQEML